MAGCMLGESTGVPVMFITKASRAVRAMCVWWGMWYVVQCTWYNCVCVCKNYGTCSCVCVCTVNISRKGKLSESVCVHMRLKIL